MGTAVMIIAIAIYIFMCIKAKEQVVNFSKKITDFVGLEIKEPITGMIILGVLIALISKLFWPLIIGIGIGILVYYWITEREKVKDFFDDLFDNLCY